MLLTTRRAANSDEASSDLGTEMGDDHTARDEENGITIEPGKTGDLTHAFDQPGAFEIGCHEPGHYDSGMKVAVTVS